MWRLVLKNVEELFWWVMLGFSDYCILNNLFFDYCLDDFFNFMFDLIFEDSLIFFLINIVSFFFLGYVLMDFYVCILFFDLVGGIKGKLGSFLKLCYVLFIDIFVLDVVKYMCLVVGICKVKWIIDRENYEK